MSKKLIVIAAFACDPNIPSEPTIGWAYLRTWGALADAMADVQVIGVMNARSKQATDRYLLTLKPGSCPNITTVGLDLPDWLRFLKNPYLTRLEYLVWNSQAKRYFKKLPADQEILLARHVTFASELLPTPISVLQQRAFTVWGPVGGAGAADAFRIDPRHRLWGFQFAQQKVRDVLSRLRSRSIGRSVDLVLTTSPAMAQDLISSGIRAEAFPNTRVDPRFQALIAEKRVQQVPSDPEPHGRGLQLLCVGHLAYSKRFELAIAALTVPGLSKARLMIIGKPLPGKDNYLSGIAASLNVQDRVDFAGQVPQKEVFEAMLGADVFIHPSSREGGSGVVGEATAVGVPVVCFKGTGAAAVLELSGGHGVQVDASGDRSVNSLAAAVIAASRLGNRPSPVWLGDRYTDAEAGLLQASSVSPSPGI